MSSDIGSKNAVGIERLKNPSRAVSKSRRGSISRVRIRCKIPTMNINPCSKCWSFCSNHRFWFRAYGQCLRKSIRCSYGGMKCSNRGRHLERIDGVRDVTSFTSHLLLIMSASQYIVKIPQCLSSEKPHENRRSEEQVDRVAEH